MTLCVCATQTAQTKLPKRYQVQGRCQKCRVLKRQKRRVGGTLLANTAPLLILNIVCVCHDSRFACCQTTRCFWDVLWQESERAFPEFALSQRAWTPNLEQV